MNRVFLSGNLTRDVEVRYTQSGKAYARAAIAVNRPFSKDVVDFINLLAWEKTAEFMGKWLAKGSRILVEGRIQTSKYKDKDGNDRTSFEVVVDQVEFAGGKKDDNNANSRKPDNDPFGGESVDEADTPF
ncbi:MAG: single-stranded DNA-binding protein [Selenomonadaceae bacterium]|nr:single-stranded DNA-binding protein [Selenomonadaceae bacterium]